MRYLVNRAVMQDLDKNTIEKMNMPGAVLMERAALAVVEELSREGLDLSQVLVICGTGNNGGDGLAVARLLHFQKVTVTVVILGKEEKMSALTKLQLSILNQYSIPVLFNNIPEKEYTTIIDAVFGIGLSRNITGEYEKAVTYMNQSPAYTVAVDIPSGIDADTGKIHHIAVKADMTVTFAYGKVGLYLFPGASYAGKLLVKDIGIYQREDICDRNNPLIFTYELQDLLLLKKRRENSHKGTYGRLLLIAGSENMSGAAFLSASSAYRSGVGLVKILTADTNRQILQSLIPEAVLETYPANEETVQIDLAFLERAMNWCDAIAIGPGLGISRFTTAIVEKVLQRTDKPVVMDADALTILAKNPEFLQNHKQPVILTPHLGEMARLTGENTDTVKDGIMDITFQFAKKNGILCVCKDSHSIVSDGNKVCLNLSGNHGMATAGSGDVLTGIIGALLAQGNDPFPAAGLGTFIHGLAGDEAAKTNAKTSMMARDLLTGINKLMITKEALKDETV